LLKIFDFEVFVRCVATLHILPFNSASATEVERDVFKTFFFSASSSAQGASASASVLSEAMTGFSFGSA
jgi:hypothetical protein